MTSGFVRFLFGDSIVARRGKVLGDAERLLAEELQPSPLVTFAYGHGNYDWLRQRGVDAVLASEHPVIDWDLVGRRDPKDNGQLNYGGYSIWRMKLDAIMRAFQWFDELVFLDFDAHLRKPLPSDFWERLRQGRPIQMPLIGYHVRHCRWRGKYNQRSVPEGAFIHLRDRSIVERAIELYAHPDRRWWTDQIIFAYAMDEMAGRLEPNTFTIDGYKADGFEPYCVNIYNQFFDAEDEVFLVSRGMPQTRWDNKQRRREKAAR